MHLDGDSRRNLGHAIRVAVWVALTGACLSLPAAEAPAAATASPLIDITVSEGTSMAVAASPDGKTLAIDLQGSIWTLPASGGTARRITDVFNDAHQPAWSPNGRQIAFFAFRDGGYDLWSIAPDGSNQHKLTWGTFDDREPSWSPDGRQIAFSSDRSEKSYDIWTLDLASGSLTRLTQNTDEDRQPTWSPDGKRIVYSRVKGSAASLWEVDVATGQERELRKPAEGRADGASFGPGGSLSYVVLTGNRSRLEIDGRDLSGKENVFPFRAAWTATGDSYFYVSDGKIRQRTPKGSAAKTIPFTATLQVTQAVHPKGHRNFDSTAPRKALGIVHPEISPDGKRVAFGALGDIYIQAIGGGLTNLTNDRFLDTDPSWSPDGTRLAYSSDRGDRLLQLRVRDLATGEDRQLTQLAVQPLAASWSPDGKRIAFLGANGMWAVAELDTVEVATGKVTRLQPTLPQPGEPTWSPDGKLLALPMAATFSASFREGTNQVWVVDANTPDAAPKWYAPIPGLSIDTRGAVGPVWSPDGTKMAAVYEGELRVWPVSPAGQPLGPPRSLTTQIAHAPSWAGDSRTLLFQSDDEIKLVDIETGVISNVPVDLQYRPAIPAGRTILRVGKLVDGKSTQARADMDILVEGNRIRQVAPRGSIVAAPGDQVVDAPNLTAMPGLIEYHAHVQKDLGEAQHRAWLAYGITTVRDPGNQPYNGVEDREAVDAGRRAGPRLYTTGHLFEWQRVFYRMGVAISGPAHLEKELQRAKVLQHDLLKSYVRLPDLQQKRVVEFAHAMDVPVATHEVYPASLVGVDATEHLGATSRRGYSLKQGPLGVAYDDVIQLFGKTGRTLTPTHFGSITAFLAKRPDLRQDPRIDLYPEWTHAAIRNSRGDAVPAGLVPPPSNTGIAIKKILEAGGLIVAGTDTPVAINLHSEISSYVDAGLTPYQALRAATVVPAQVLGLDAGSIEAGKLADIVLVEGNPLQDITTTANVRQVVANGRLYSYEELLHPR
jgi:Tol biopolymer transport system component/imidazolonepropionase-like amidohydrolase